MISDKTPCFTPRTTGAKGPPVLWKPSGWQPHPHRLNTRKAPPQHIPLERVEPVLPDLPPPRPVNELTHAMVRHFDACIGKAGTANLLQRHGQTELQHALKAAREIAGNWVRLCNQQTMDRPRAVENAQKILKCLQGLLTEVREHADALDHFSDAMPDLQAAEEDVRRLQTQLEGLPDYLKSVWPSDGSWDRRPPTLGHVLMLMHTTTHAELVKARLEDGQAPLSIASEPSGASTRDVERLQKQLAHALRNPDFALPLSEAMVLLASPPVPVDAVLRGLRCGLNATETRALFEAGVPIHPQTAPDPELKRRLAAMRPVPTQQVGKGLVNQVHLLGWASDLESVCLTWRPERPGAFADAMDDCGIPTRGPLQWHLPGPNLTGRQVLTHRLAELLPLDANGVMVTQAWPAVMDGVYGSLNAYVPGLRKQLLDSPHDIALGSDDIHWLRQRAETPALLADIARQQGLTGLALTDTGLQAQASLPQSGGGLIKRHMVRPLHVDDPWVRRQMVAAVWFQLLTGQADWNTGNLAFVADAADPDRQLLVLFDNDLAFGRAVMHPEDLVNNARQQPPGPRVRAPRSALYGTRLPDVVPADLAEALLTLSDRMMLECGAAGLITLPEFRALQSRLHHIRARLKQLKADGHGWLHTQADWLTPETTQRLGLADLAAQIDTVAGCVLQPPGRTVDTSFLREIDSSSLLRSLAVAQEVARRHPQQDWFPVVLDTQAIAQALQDEMRRVRSHTASPDIMKT